MKTNFHDIQSFAEAHLNHEVQTRDAAGAEGAATFSELWRKAAECGILGLSMPTQFGGQERDAVELALALEALGLGCVDAGLCLGLAGQVLAVQQPLVEFGTPQQQAATLPDLISGQRIGAICLTEPEAGSDVTSMTSVAKPDGGDFLISGQKHYIGNAPIADFGLVFAKTTPERGAWGISVFLVDFDDPAIQRHQPQDKSGLRSLPMGAITFENLRVPASAMIGTQGAGAAIFRRTLEWERSLIFAPSVGAMQRQLEDCNAHAKTRVQFGQPVRDFQSVSNRLADMRLRIETSRLLLLKAAEALTTGKDTTLMSSMAKLHISEAAYASAQDALRIYAGSAYLKGHEIERSLRDLAGGLIYSGTSDIQRGIISDLI